MQVSTRWIYSPKFDLITIIGPPVGITLFVLCFGKNLAQMDQMPTWLWVLLVLGIDVAHVYSSLFRTYFDREEFQRRKSLYIIVPILSWVIGAGIYLQFGVKIFWACIAYLAIYHFVRQQYGFMMLYRRGEPIRGLGYRIDQIAIYLATVYPLVYWHTYPRNFQWFSDFDVIHIPVVWPEQLFRVAYVVSLIGFAAKELWRWKTKDELNAGKILLLYATAAAWGTGIILFNGDLTFSLINIISHGIPYMALIWIYQFRKRSNPARANNPYLKFFQLKYIPLYILTLVAIAYFEEGLWDKLVWFEHPEVFGKLYLPVSALALVFLAPLLTMPQVTHYILDAFIWRVNRGKEEVRGVIG